MLGTDMHESAAREAVAWCVAIKAAVALCEESYALTGRQLAACILSLKAPPDLANALNELLAKARQDGIEQSIAAVRAKASSGENIDEWTITRDKAFMDAEAAIRAARTPTDTLISQEAARAMLAALGAETCRTAVEREAFDWAEDVALWFFLDEAQDEWRDSGETMRSFMARDLAYRLGTQLPEMAKDAHPDEAREQRALARAGERIAERLLALADQARGAEV